MTTYAKPTIFYVNAGLSLLLMSGWVGGMLGKLLIGAPLSFSLYNAWDMLAAGYVGTTALSILSTLLLLLSFFGIARGGVLRVTALKFLVGVAGLLCFFSLCINLYNALFHTHFSLLPWHWVTLAFFSPAGVNTHYVWYVAAGMATGLFLIWLIFFMPTIKSPLADSHFASAKEIEKAGLFSEQGIVLAKAHGKMLRVTGFEPVLVVAPMGSGKTTAFAIPNLIEWSDSVVVNDLKGELWEKTATYREKVKQNSCYCWAPGDESHRSHRHNPFTYVSKDKRLWYRDLQLIAQALMPIAQGEQAFWVQSSRDLFLLLSMFLIETKGMATLEEIYHLAKQENFEGWLGKVIGMGKYSFPKTIIANAAALIDADDRTRSNILQDFYARITLFGDPIIQKNTAASDFDLRELRKQRMSVYIHIPEREKERLAPLLSLFWAQFVDSMTIKEPDLSVEPYAVLALMDEFGNLSKIDKLKSGMSFLRSFHIIPAIIVQYLGQIESVYGKVDLHGFLNTKIKMAYTLNDKDDAEYISQCLGQTTVMTKGRSISTHTRSSGVSINESDQLKPLMRKEEIMRLPKEQALILVEGHMPIRAKKCFWFKESLYKNQLNTRRAA